MTGTFNSTEHWSCTHPKQPRARQWPPVPAVNSTPLPPLPFALFCSLPMFQVVSDPNMAKSGVYWSWNNNTGAFENQVSEEVADDGKAVKLWEVSEKLVGLA